MSAIPYEDDGEETWDDSEEGLDALPVRRRLHFSGRRTAALIALITAAGGFYAGIRVEKGQVSSSSGSTGGLRLPALSGRSASTGRGSSSAPTGGFPGGGFPGGAFGGGNSSTGTVASVNGKTIYVTGTTGNTVKVTLSSATKVTKNLAVGKASVRPGDSLVIQGLKQNGGAIVATSISDSGARTTGTSGGSSASNGSSAVNSLFGSGG